MLHGHSLIHTQILGNDWNYLDSMSASGAAPTPQVKSTPTPGPAGETVALPSTRSSKQ